MTYDSLITEAEYVMELLNHPSDSIWARLIAALREAEADKIKLEAREQRGREYLVSITGFGSEDPLDFLIASHAYINIEKQDLKEKLQKANQQIIDLEIKLESLEIETTLAQEVAIELLSER